MTLQELMKRAPVTRITPTREHKDKIETAMSWLIVNAPFFADLAYRKLPVVFTRDVPIAATDGFCILINPEPFFKYELREQVFILAHEVMHYVYGDIILMHVWRAAGQVQVRPGVILPYNDDLMNEAEDYRINAMLIASNVGKFNPDWLFDISLSEKGFESGLDVYEKLWQRKQQNQQPKPQRPGGIPQKGKGGPAQFDKHMQPGEAGGQDPDQVTARSNDSERAVAVAAAEAAAEAMGQLPGSLKRVVGEILNPKVPWQDHVRSTLFRRLFGDGYDWSMPDRRLIARDYCGPFSPVYFARNANHSCGTLVIGVDVSGSIGKKMVARFFGEMQGIVEAVNPAHLVVIWCDAKVQRVDELEEVQDLTSLKIQIDHDGVPGGGGTDFRPVFKDIEKLGLEPECLVFFTDTLGTFPDKAPHYPVIWGNINKNGKAPWGDLVNIEV